MSRSVKKNPVYTDGRPNTLKRFKRYANKCVRNHDDEIYNGKMYKKLYCSWNIHDYTSRCSWDEFKKDYENNKKCYSKFSNIKELYRYWRNIYKNK